MVTSEAAQLSINKTQSLCSSRDAGRHISIHIWKQQKHLGKEHIKTKKIEYIQLYLFTFFQKSQFLSHKWFDVLWVLNKACKIAGAASVLISNPIKGSNQVHFCCSTVCLYHKWISTGVEHAGSVYFNNIFKREIFVAQKTAHVYIDKGVFLTHFLKLWEYFLKV